MQIRIKADPIGPVSLVAELPDAQLAVMEGLNGIGKTLSIRLLQLCSGGQPYSTQSASWMSLANSLGAFEVTVVLPSDQLALEWIGDSRDWAGKEAAPLGERDFRSVRIGGKPATMSEVRRLFAVHRLAGDEGIVETFASQLDAQADLVRHWARSYVDQSSGPLAAVERAADFSASLLGRWTLDEYLKLIQQFDDARSTADARARQLASSQKEWSLLSELQDIRSRLAHMSEHAPALTAQVRRLDNQVRDLQTLRDNVVQRVSALGATVVASQPALKELENARKTLGQNRDRLADSLSNAARLATRLEVSAEWPAVSELVATLEHELIGLEQQRRALDAAPAMRTVLDRIIPQLDDADRQGLGDEVAIDDPVNEVELTVSQSKAGMAARRTFLEGKPPEPQTREVGERISATEKRLGDSKALLQHLQNVDRWQRLVETNENRVESALAKINPGAIQEIRKLQSELNDADSRLLKLAAERAAALQELGAVGDETTRQSLKLKLDHGLNDRQLTEDQLSESVRAADLGSRQAQAATTRAREVAASLRRDVARADLEIRDATTRLLNSPELDWVRETVMSPPTLALTDSTRSRVEAIDAARAVIDSILRRVTDFRSQIGALETALRGIARRLQARQPEGERYLTSLTRYFNDHFSEWFNNPRVRRELLPTAEGPIGVDLERREVAWREGSKSLARPLEAFSSGEQAFAYTRARLAILDEDPTSSRWRLIVLDEFGAFIAHDRLSGLFSYLQERAKEHPHDQVLIVLPLSRDYVELSRSAAGRERGRYQSLADQVAQRGYAVQLLST